MGQSVCPMLAEPGQQLADVAANVSDAIGKPLGPATMFTGLAITMFCPAAVASLANGVRCRSRWDARHLLGDFCTGAHRR